MNLSILSCALTLLILILCGSGPALAADKVVLQLRWDHQFQFAGYYAALWQGYYAEAGLEVELRSGVTPEGRILEGQEEVISGRADFGIGGADILLARERGEPLVVCATIFQRSATAFYAQKGTGLRTPADLVGRNVARMSLGLADAELKAMLLYEGIAPSSVPPFPHRPGLEQLLAGDVIAGYTIEMPYHASRQGLELSRLRPADYGVDFYGDTLYTTAESVRRRPDRVARFVEASLRGWEYALAHPGAIAERIAATFSPAYPIGDFQAFNRFQIEPVKALTLYPVVRLGHTNPYRWVRMHDTLREMGMVRGELDPQALIFTPEKIAEHKAQQSARRLRWTLWGGGLAVGLALAALARMAVRQALLRKQEKRLRTIFNAVPEGLFLFETDGALSFVNETGKGMFGRKGANADEAAPFTPPLAEVRQRGGMGPLEWRLVRPPDHRPFEVEAYLRTIDLEGREVVLVALRDITERKEMEGRLRAIFHNVAAGIAVFSPEGRYLKVNERWAEMLGFSPQEIVGRTYTDLTFAEDLPKSRRMFEGLVAGEYPLYRLEKRYRRKDGSVFWADLSVTRITEAKGEVEAVVGVFIDITEQKAVEEALRAANRELEGFVYTVSHDLRTPLTPIIGYADHLRENCRDRLPPEEIALLGEIASQGHKMLALMENLLALARVGHIERPRNAVDVARVVAGVVSDLTPTGDAPSVEISSPLPRLHLAATLVEQIFANLIGNALRYGGTDGGPVEVGGEPRGNKVAYFVRDHGPGIPAGERERIFDLFFRGATGQRVKGSGIGLAIVQKIARLGGGRAWAEETPGGGATFWVEMEWGD